MTFCRIAQDEKNVQRLTRILGKRRHRFAQDERNAQRQELPRCSGFIQSCEHCNAPHNASHGVVIEKPRCAQEPLLLVQA